MGITSMFCIIIEHNLFNNIRSLFLCSIIFNAHFLINFVHKKWSYSALCNFWWALRHRFASKLNVIFVIIMYYWVFLLWFYIEYYRRIQINSMYFQKVPKTSWSIEGEMALSSELLDSLDTVVVLDSFSTLHSSGSPFYTRSSVSPKGSLKGFHGMTRGPDSAQTEFLVFWQGCHSCFSKMFHNFLIMF